MVTALLTLNGEIVDSYHHADWQTSAVSLDAIFDSAHFPDGTNVVERIKMWDSAGRYFTDAETIVVKNRTVAFEYPISSGTVFKGDDFANPLVGHNYTAFVTQSGGGLRTSSMPWRGKTPFMLAATATRCFFNQLFVRLMSSMMEGPTLWARKGGLKCLAETLPSTQVATLQSTLPGWSVVCVALQICSHHFWNPMSTVGTGRTVKTRLCWRTAYTYLMVRLMRRS